MHWFHWVASRVRALVQKRRLDAEMDEELQLHVELKTQRNLEAGLSPDEARRRALLEFGTVESIREQCRDQRGVRWLEQLAQDLRYGARMLARNPGFTAVAGLTLALGIGVNATMFTALQTLLNRALPYHDPDGLVQLFHISPGSSRAPHHSAPNFLDYAASGTFASVAAVTDKQFNLAEPGAPAERVPGLQVTASFFPLLGIPPELGRVFTADEDRPGHNQVVVLDHGFWQRRFAGDPNIIGRTLRLDGESVTVIGVMPATFHDLLLTGPGHFWRPLAFTPDQRQQRGHHYLKCIARLKPGMTLAQAQAAAAVLAERHHREYPESAPPGLRVEALARSSLPPQARMIAWSVMGLAAFVLLIACANLANLLLARTALRNREFAIRRALGAPRTRLVRQLFAESLLLAAVGGLAGLALAQWSNALLRRELVVNGEPLLNLTLNLRVFLFVAAITAISGLVFGPLPAWLALRGGVGDALKRGTRGTTETGSQLRLQHLLVVAEVALALVLLAGASLLIHGLRSFGTLQPGWKVDGLSLGYLTLPEAKYPDGDALRTFVDQLEARLAALPGVERAAACWNLPIRQFNVTSTFLIDGRPEPPPDTVHQCSVNGITPGYFDTLEMRILAGREFTRTDRAGQPPVVIINETMARAFWPDRSPLGDRVNGAEIVGVVNSVRFPANPAEERTPYQTYRPYAQEPRLFLNIAVRGIAPGEALRRAVTELDPDQPVGQAGPAAADIGAALDNWAIGGRLLTCFAGLGLSLAALGLYGVISGFVVRRTGEIGLRMALGAQVRNVWWLVVGKGLRLSLLGAALGLIGAVGLARLMRAVLPGLPGDITSVLAACVAFLAAVAVVACWWPARCAARLDPMEALRQE